MNVYANDDLRGNFPRFDNPGIHNTWDLDPRMISSLGPYGLTVPMWYCPVRPNEFDTDNSWCLQNRGHPLNTLTDLTATVTRAWGFAVCRHSWWVPRIGDSNPSDVPNAGPGGIYPYIKANKAPNNLWPASTADKRLTQWPILTDYCLSQSNSTPSLAGAGHPYKGHLKSVNVVYGDAHVELHSVAKIQMQYSGNYYCFY